MLSIGNKYTKNSLRPIPKNAIGIHDSNKDNCKRLGQWVPSGASNLRRYNSSESKDKRTLHKNISSRSTSVTPRRKQSIDEFSNHECKSFQRSLKLLGLHPKDLGISGDIPKTYISPHSVGPTFHTRITKRSFSVENLKSAIQEQMSEKASGDHVSRKTLCDAVYEEWYFRKLEEARKKKEAQDLEARKKQEDVEIVKKELQQKVEENFRKWKQMKDKQKQQCRQKKVVEGSGDFTVRSEKTRSNQEQAFLSWKREKNKLLKQKKSSNNIKMEATKSDDRKFEAELVYKAWKKHADEIMKERAQEELLKKQKVEEEKKEKEKERRESAKLSFNAWKTRKDEELKKKIRENKLAEEQKKDEQAMHETDRLYEAEQAFDEWLTQVEERRNKQIDAVHKSKRSIQHQFPWSPVSYRPPPVLLNHQSSPGSFAEEQAGSKVEDAIITSVASSRTLETPTSSKTENTYVSPEEVRPFPKAPPRKLSCHGRKRGRCMIATDSPEKNEIVERKCKNSMGKQAEKRRVRQRSSSSLEEVGENTSDSDQDSYENEVEPIYSLHSGDFVIVRVSGKNTSRNYVAQIVNRAVDGYDVKFFKRQIASNRFIETDEPVSFVSYEETVLKLPEPIKDNK
ncbi:hypothetical protein ANN_00650 [Periplaneta americana]|uniref:Uncharacterized protein n=1 Tax=Periplaneta americana TaxID=6978 RepID=A0ABQ8TTT0_PERAM|nr:hypothetical protein ANN_00650 [Periplaneta americana]